MCSRPGFTKKYPRCSRTSLPCPALIQEVLADPDLAHDDVLASSASGRAAGPCGRRGHRGDRRRPLRAHPGPAHTAQRETSQEAGHHGRGGGPGHPQAAAGIVLPVPAVTAQTGRQGPVRRDLLSLDRGRGVSTRKVDDLVKALGNESGTSRSTVSRICKDIGEGVAEFLPRPLDHTWFPYLFVDATYLDVRLGHRVVCQAPVVATGVSAQGRREILGMALGDAETTDFWTPFLRSLRQRGLRVTTDQAPRGSCWSPATPTPVSAPRSRRSCPAPPDSAAPRLRPSPNSTGPRSGPTTPSSASTARSSAAPTSCRSSPTGSPSPA